MKNLKFIKVLVVALVALASLGCGNSSNFDTYETQALSFKPNAATVEIGSPDVALTFEATLWDGSTYQGSLSELLAHGYSLGYFNYTLEGEDGSPATNSVLDPNTGTIKVGDTPGVFKVSLLAYDSTVIDTFTLTVVEPTPVVPEKTITGAVFHDPIYDNNVAENKELEVGESFTLTFDVTYSDGTSAENVSYQDVISAGYKVVLHYNHDNSPSFNSETGVITLEDGQTADFFELYRADVTPGHNLEDPLGDEPMWLSGISVGYIPPK